MAHSDYLHHVLDKSLIKQTISFVCKKIKAIECDSIAFSGMSGALIAPIVAYKTGKNLILVRKIKDDSHSTYAIESSSYCCKKYVVIDDLIASGKTITHIIESVNKQFADQVPECGGIILYSEDYYRKTFDGEIPVYARE